MKKTKKLLNTFNQEKIYINFNHVYDYLIEKERYSPVILYNNIEEIINAIKDVFGVESIFNWDKRKFEFNLNDEDYLPKDLHQNRGYI
jgi:hypothetical protein